MVGTEVTIVLRHPLCPQGTGGFHTVVHHSWCTGVPAGMLVLGNCTRDVDRVGKEDRGKVGLV